MRLLLAALACLALSALGAAAQTTICNRIGDSVYCKQSNPPDYMRAVPDTMGQMKAGSDYVDSIYESTRKAEAELRRKRVGSMVAAGQCDQARAAALKAGDFGLAKEVDGFCHH